MTYKAIYKILKAKIKKDYGKECPDFLYSCHICDQYLMLQILEDNVCLENEKV